MRAKWKSVQWARSAAAVLFAGMVVTGGVRGADSVSVREVKAAFNRLSEAGSYTFSFEQRQGAGKPEEVLYGKTVRDGWTCLRLKVGGRYWCYFVFNGKRGVVAVGDSDWMSASELQSKEFRAKMDPELKKIMGRTVVGTLINYQSPPEQAAMVAAHVETFRNEGRRKVGDVKGEMLEKLFGPETRRYTLWVEMDRGLPLRWGFQQERASMGADKREVRTTAEFTVGITAIGSTELEIPPAAKEKLEKLAVP